MLGFAANPLEDLGTPKCKWKNDQVNVRKFLFSVERWPKKRQKMYFFVIYRYAFVPIRVQYS